MDAHETSGLTSRLILTYAERLKGHAAVSAILDRCGLSEYRDYLRSESAWFDFDTKIRLFEAAAVVLGDPDASYSIGAAAVELSVFTGLKLAMRAVGSPKLVYSTLARHAWKFTSAHRLDLGSVDDTSATFTYTDISGAGYHQLDCRYNAGMLSAVPTMFGLAPARVRHSQCALEGAGSCVYELRWEPDRMALRRKAAQWTAASVVALGAGATLSPRRLRTAVGVPALGGAVLARQAMIDRRRQRSALETEVRDQKELAERLATSLRDLVCDLRVDEVLGKIVSNAQAALPGREFALLVRTDGGLLCRSSSRVPPDSLRALELWASRSDGLLDVGMTLDELTSVPELARLPKHAQSPLGALYSAPLEFRGDRLGALVALAHGADGFMPQERGVLDAYADQAALALANARLFAQLEELARRDPLTGLLNRREFHKTLERELARAEHYGRPVTIVMLDLDGFKEVNDMQGHAEGDAVLRAVAEVLEANCTRDGSAFRIGGDEFALLLPGAAAAEGTAAAEQVERAVAGLDRGVTASHGLAVWPDEGPSEDLLLFNADRALYERKAGRSVGPRSEPVARPAASDDRHLKTVTRALARAVDAKDSYTRSHCETVSELSGMIAEQLGLAAERVAKIRLAGLLHDVGKIGIPDAILQKPDRLTDEEFEVMKRHSTLGHTIVSGADLPEEAVWVRHHHERPDGRGYPDGLSGAAIPLESRIILVADAFEAITSDRPYRRGRLPREALAEIERNAGTQFDADCVAALRRSLGTGARELFDPIPSPEFGDSRLRS